MTTTEDGALIHTLPTGHRLQVREFIQLGKHGVTVRADVTDGDGRQYVDLMDEEMDALCAWWLSRKVV